MSRTNKILISVVAAGLAVCAYYFLVLAPKREELVKLDQEVAAEQAELAQAQQTLASYEEARTSYKANYSLLTRLGKAVPGDDDVRSLLVQLQSTAERTGVDFEKIELGSGVSGAASAGGAAAKTPATTADGLALAPGAVPVAGGVLSAMPFNFAFTGGFFDLSQFFSKLERYVTVNNERIEATGRLLRVENISITLASNGYPNMKAQIGAAAYLVPSTEGVPAAGGAPAGTAPAAPTAPGTTPPTTTATAGAAQ